MTATQIILATAGVACVAAFAYGAVCSLIGLAEGALAILLRERR